MVWFLNRCTVRVMDMKTKFSGDLLVVLPVLGIEYVTGTYVPDIVPVPSVMVGTARYTPVGKNEILPD